MDVTAKVFQEVAARRMTPHEGALILRPPRPRWLAFLLALLLGCATTKPPPSTFPPYLSGADLEQRALPPDPETEALPKGLDPEERVDSLEAGDKAPHAGILSTEARAVRDGYYRLRYKELRKDYISDLHLVAAERALYERQIQLDRAKIEELTPPPLTWWDLHSGEVIAGTALTLGLTVGAGLTVGVAYAVAHVTVTK